MIVVRGLPPDLILCEEASVSVQKPLFLVSSSLQDNYERKFLAATSLLSRFSVQKHLWQKIASLEILEFQFFTDSSQKILLVVRQKCVHLAFSGTRICSN